MLVFVNQLSSFVDKYVANSDKTGFTSVSIIESLVNIHRDL